MLYLEHMKGAYALLGILFLILIGGTLFLANRAEAPEITSITGGQESQTLMKTFTLQSTGFEPNGTIPSKYTCDGENVSVPLSWSGVPEGTISLTLIMDDSDIPDSVKEGMGIEAFDHWVVFNMPPDTQEIQEGETPPGIEGAHSGGGVGYTGPCPPDREHRYIFTLYALDTKLDLSEGATKADVLHSLDGHVIEEATLTGLYNRS